MTAHPLKAPGGAVAGSEIRSRTWATCVCWALVGSAACAVLLAAWYLTPAPQGHGTHTQLGLPPCGFLALTSLPCPGCGLTTSFAYMARLEPYQAAVAHPLGVVLYLLTASMLPISVLGAVRRWSPSAVLAGPAATRLVLALALAAALIWSVRLVS